MVDHATKPAGSGTSSLQAVLSSLTVITAYAYALGWLKNLYYFKSFGIGLEALELSSQDHIIQSWFVIENAVFFLILFWTAVKAQRWWVWAVFAIYFMLPVASHYAFLVTGHWTAIWLITYRHTVLKFVPFIVLGILVSSDRASRTRLKDLSWPYSGFLQVVCVLVFLAWSVSAAKHFGSYDANLQLRWPDDHLVRSKVHVANSAPELLPLESAQNLYMIHTGPKRIVLWDSTGFSYEKPGQHLHIVIIPVDKIAWVDIGMERQVQPGKAYF